VKRSGAALTPPGGHPKGAGRAPNYPAESVPQELEPVTLGEALEALHWRNVERLRKREEAE
jgi:hypothetical protein